jgi:hypothetical protein
MKKTMAFVAGSVLAFTIAACGGSQKQDTTPPPPVEEMPDAGTGMEDMSTPTGMTGNPCGPAAGEASAEAATGNPCGK